ncbi:beta-N-acetylhexosaminidase [Nocardioides sp. MJB4]|uniref:beta-N-acetylhexosaminidase n=2 Tax=Nocardioides donggukensis TaxID=2774019 RepID=A0A927K2M4_9ACTN|nr:beta-N-acetylhexosaminidase [Nocardioides donggukensis]
MTLPQLAGQVIVARYAGRGAPVDLVRRLHLGGVIAFSDNVSAPSAAAAANRTLRRAVGRPLLIGVDQEGGLVERVRGGATRFPAFMAAGAADDPGLTRAAARASGGELAGLGFDVVFAPVADVTSGPGDPTIGSRSPGSDPDLVSRHALAAARGLAAAGVVPVVKHFPGHGSVPADSHRVLPVQRRSLARLRQVDLRPFAAAVDAGLPAVMVGHLDVAAVDPGVPSSLSGPVLTGLLRGRLGFDGLVVTDALDMAAVRDRVRSRAVGTRALRAGADVVLMPRSPAAARAGIVGAVRSGRLPRERLEEAATRMLATLGHADRVRPRPTAPGSGAAASRRLSAAAVTVVAGPCSGRLVGDGVRVRGSDPAQVATFRAAARAAGLPLGAGTNVTLLGRGADPVRRGVAVALATPYVLGRSRAPVRIATFGSTPGAMSALVQVLLGRARAPGRLPVEVPGVRAGC